GTKIMVASAPVLRTASATVLNRGKPSLAVPPLPGTTPPTTCVPYARHWMAWKVPALPMPWQRTRVFLSTRMLIGFPLVLRPADQFRQVRRPLICRLVQVTAVAGQRQVTTEH